MKRKRERLRKLFYPAIALVFASFSLVYSCRPLPPVFDPNNEIGVVDFYGFITDGVIPEDVKTEIAGKEVGIVSKGFLYRYGRMQKYLKDNNISIDEGGSQYGSSDDMDRTVLYFRSFVDFKHRSMDPGI